jgi:hypothetical protein
MGIELMLALPSVLMAETDFCRLERKLEATNRVNVPVVSS